MRWAATIALLGVLGCRPGPAKIRSIGIQPIDFPDPVTTAFVQHQLMLFFNCPVTILPAAKVPATFQNLSKGERYSADSVLGWLDWRRPDSLFLVLGLTRKNIFITKRDSAGRVREPAEKYAVWGILGLGGCPGRVCVVSDARFVLTDPHLYPHRLRTLVLHEVCHNLGLPHCTTPHCIMNDANEQIATIDNAGDDLCAECRRKLDLH